MDKVQHYRNWLKKAHVAGGMNKMAADKEALDSIKDPSEQGTATIPQGTADANRARLGLPTNAKNPADAHDNKLMQVTDPQGVGQGSYITPQNGNAQENAATSPGSPLSKIAQATAALNQAVSAMQVNPVNQKQAAQNLYDLPENIINNPALMQKLACAGLIMMGTQEGTNAVHEVVERAAGIKEANAIVNEVASAMHTANQEYMKQASYAQQAAYATQAYDNAEMQKQAAAKQSYEYWINVLPTDMEKLAFAQGAMDGEAMAGAVEAGGAPTISGAEQITPEQVMEVLQSLVASGQIAPEEAEALLQELAAEEGGPADIETAVAAIQEALAAGQIDEATAQALVTQLLAEAGIDPAAIEGAAAAPAAPSPEELAMAAPDAAVKAASAVNFLYGR